MKKGTAITFTVGIFAGIALCGPAAQAANAITATLSSQPIYVDGQRVSMTAYHIGGNNYVKLRDIGRAVNFGVAYDASTNSVHIDPYAPYVEEAAPSTTQTPAALTEETVLVVLTGLEKQYPHGTHYPAPCISSSGGPYGVSSRNCAGWATLCSDAAFGSLPWRRVDHPSWEQIRVGDLVRYDIDTSGHVVVVTKKTDDTVFFTESGLTQKVYWGANVPRWWLEEQPGLTLYTRYPG